MSQMLKSSGALGAATLTSRILGMVREIAYARFMGDGWVAGAFTLAFTIPNLFRRLLGEGALTAAFIPIFKEKEKTEGEKEMWRAANAVISGLLVSAFVIVGLVLLGITVALHGFHFNAETRLMLELLRVIFPYMLLVCLAAVYIGMLNSRGHFFIPAMGATTLNVVMIASVFWVAPRFGDKLETQIFGLAVGVLVAGVAQALFQWPTLRREGYAFEWVSPWRNPTVKKVVTQMVPGMLGVAAFQINILLTQALSFCVDPMIVASYNYAVRLMELPQGVFGISLATYLLPTLSGLAAEKKYPEFKATLRQGVNHLVYINLLASVLLLVLAEPIVRLLFERGQFGPLATQRAAFALACLAPGLVAFSLVNILARAFYALGDTRTPMLISVVCLMLNLVFAGALVIPLGQGGLGIANTFSATCNVALLFFALRKKLKEFEIVELERQFAWLLVLAVLAGGVAWLSAWFWEAHWGHLSLLKRLGLVFVPASLAAGAYFGLSAWLKLGSTREIFGLALNKLRREPSR
ncbi:MAG: murein biosynthesis integral membrane protein MurJ [Verrucomicrobiota bacterium]